jgi:hypothetical protein
MQTVIFLVDVDVNNEHALAHYGLLFHFRYNELLAEEGGFCERLGVVVFNDGLEPFCSNSLLLGSRFHGPEACIRKGTKVVLVDEGSASATPDSLIIVSIFFI